MQLLERKETFRLVAWVSPHSAETAYNAPQNSDVVRCPP